MRNLRKDTGGYALLYVLVVIILLCAVAMMICTVSMQNLTAQQKSVERMVDKYAAQGEVEKILAQIPEVPMAQKKDTGSDTARNFAESAYKELYEALDGSDEFIKCTIDENSAIIEIKYEGIKAELKTTLTRTQTEIKENDRVTGYEYSITSSKPELVSYTIENGGAA